MGSAIGLTAALVVFAGISPHAVAQTLTLQDGTPVRLRLMKTVTSADAKVGETVDFEVSEPVVVQNLVAIQKGSLALGKVTRSETKRRFGRAGELVIQVESVRLSDGNRALLRASADKSADGMGGARLAATIAASPVLVFVKGKNVTFEKGMETTAYLNGDVRIGQTAGTPAVTTPETTSDRVAASGSLTNADVIQMRKAGLSDELIMAKIKTSTLDFRTSPQDLIQLKESGIGEPVIALILEKSKQ